MSALDELKKLLKEAQLTQQKNSSILVEDVRLVVKEENPADVMARLLNERHISKQSLVEDLPSEASRWQDPLVPVNKRFVTFKEMNDHYGSFLQRIQKQLASIGGGGEVNLRNLDDVDRSTIEDGLFLKYDSATRKFVFDSKIVESPSVTTKLVTTATYNVVTTDSYVGINFAGAVNITLPNFGVDNGRLIYIKDESGLASLNPINILATIDNDPTGATLQIDNGCITLIYRNGWRIV